MQQPLAHLYFLTVFEDLLSSNFGLPNLIRTSQKIAKVFMLLNPKVLTSQTASHCFPEGCLVWGYCAVTALKKKTIHFSLSLK